MQPCGAALTWVCGGRLTARMALTVRPLTPDLWPALEDLFGRQGASNGCWCMYWRLGRDYTRRPREANRADLRAIVEHGPPPGLLALDGELAVGWCQVTPRAALPYAAQARYVQPVDDSPVWLISCFYVRRSYRGRGVTSALIAEALRVAKRAGAPALEAFPIDTRAPKATRNRYPGIASSFAQAGFKVIARRAPDRPIMRHDLEGV
jgi:GNAT superfamily N-acetyltransferase